MHIVRELWHTLGLVTVVVLAVVVALGLWIAIEAIYLILNHGLYGL